MFLLSISRQNHTHTDSAGGVFYCLTRSANTQDSHVSPRARDTLIALFCCGLLLSSCKNIECL